MAESTLAAILAEIKNNVGKFYVYVLSYPDGTPFYVGCGMAGKYHPRIMDHEKLALSSNRHRRSMKSSIIRKILRNGGSVGKSIDSWHLTPIAMFDREIQLISAIGRRDRARGTLANGNDGGTGQLNPTMEAREASSAGLKAWWTDERRERARETARIRFGSAAALEKMRIACASPEWRARQSKATKGALADPEKGKRIREAINAALRTPEYRKRRSEFAKTQFQNQSARDLAAKNQKALWADPQYREKAAEHCRQMGQKYWSTPEAKERARIASSRPWSPEIRERCSERQKASWTPERRAATAERMRIMRAAQEEARRVTLHDKPGSLHARGITD